MRGPEDAMMTREDFVELVELILEGAATDEQVRRVDEAARSSAELRATYVQIAEMDALLKGREFEAAEVADVVIERIGRKGESRAMAKAARRRVEDELAREGSRRASKRSSSVRLKVARGRRTSVFGYVIVPVAVAASLLVAYVFQTSGTVRPDAPVRVARPAPEPERPADEVAAAPAPVVVPAPSDEVAEESEVATVTPARDEAPEAPEPGVPLPGVVATVDAGAEARAEETADDDTVEAPVPRGAQHETTKTVAYVDSVEGLVQMRRGASGAWRTAAAGVALETGDGFRTRLSRALVRFESGSVLHVDRFTTGSMCRADAANGLSLVGGRVFVEVADGDEGFTVETPHGRAVDLGTRFGVEVELRKTDVLVAEGRVEAATDAGSVEVTAGRQTVLLRRTSPPTPTRPAPDLEKRFSWARTGSGGLAGKLRERKVRTLALYTFAERRGTVVRDRSGFGRPLDLKIMSGASARWTRTGLLILKPTVVRSAIAAIKIVKACKGTNEITIEAWIVPASADQIGPARIVTMAGSLDERNVMLGQGSLNEKVGSKCAFRLNAGATEMRQLWTPAGSIGTDPVHIVCERSASGVERIYLDGRRVAEGNNPGTLRGWNETYALLVGNEVSMDRPWLGELRRVAIYDRALGEDIVRGLYRAGKARARK